MIREWVIAFLFRILGGFLVEAWSLLLSVEIFTEGATGAVRHVYILGVGNRFQLIFHCGRKPHWLTASTVILSRPALITVVVILYVHDVMQSAGLFHVAIGLSPTTSWRKRIVRQVSYK